MAETCYIVEDLVMEIQLRLPVRSLMRFKSVCKLWNARFRSTEFKTAYDLKQKLLNGNNYDNSKILLNHGDGPWLDISKAFYEQPQFLTSMEAMLDADNRTIITHVKYLDSTLKGYYRSSLISTCNGVVCIQNHRQISLLNPATREFRVLPPSSITNVDQAYSENFVGFGFDISTKDYKVIRFISPYVLSNNRQCRIELYTLSTNSWREITIDADRFSDLRLHYHNYAYIDGVCHWRRRNKNELLSFDMVDEVFSETPLPDIGEATKCIQYHLCSFHEYPVVIVYVREIETCFEVWALKKLGCKESWVKELRIGPLFNIHRPICFWKNDKLFMQRKYKEAFELVVYDPISKELETLQFISEEEFDIVFYVESLVSL